MNGEGIVTFLFYLFGAVAFLIYIIDSLAGLG